MKSRLPLLLVAVGVLLVAPKVGAKLCGDNVDGRDVPCACGDTVVSDLVLNDDPVLGSGNGAGVWVVNGGAGGARVVSSGGVATVEGFRDGVLGHGADSVRLVEGVNVLRSARDGMRVAGDNYEIRNSEARDSGRDGYNTMGKGFHLTATRAVNSGRFGYFVMGQDGNLGAPGAGCVTEGSGDAGFNIMGMGNHLVDCAASGAHKDGLHLNGMMFDISGCVAQDNRGDGIAGMGGGWTVTGNRAENNDGNGIVVSGREMADGGGNSGTGNRGLGQQRPAAQPCDRGWQLPCSSPSPSVPGWQARRAQYQSAPARRPTSSPTKAPTVRLAPPPAPSTRLTPSETAAPSTSVPGQ